MLPRPAPLARTARTARCLSHASHLPGDGRADHGPTLCDA